MVRATYLLQFRSSEGNFFYFADISSEKAICAMNSSQFYYHLSIEFHATGLSTAILSIAPLKNTMQVD